MLNISVSFDEFDIFVIIHGTFAHCMMLYLLFLLRGSASETPGLVASRKLNIEPTLVYVNHNDIALILTSDPAPNIS